MVKDKSVKEVGKGKDGYDVVLSDVVGLLEEARRSAARSVNAIMTATYWEIGRRIVEYEQGGKHRAEYAKSILNRLSKDLTSRLGRGFSQRNLRLMREFYISSQNMPIWQTASAKLKKDNKKQILQTASGEFSDEKIQATYIESPIDAISASFPLPWSHYVRLLSVKNALARAFYEEEALRNGWTVRQLCRQIDSQFYERTAMSHNKEAMLKRGAYQADEDNITPEQEIKDPFVLEFLDLKDEYSESYLEEALIGRLESFLLELRGHFTFVGRQRRLRVGNEWFRVDLVFFHRRLRCLVVIDLKLGKFTPADAGQMHFYLNYARENWTNTDENPPVGLILCAGKNVAVAHYALDGLPNKVMAAEYLTALPGEDVLVAQLSEVRRNIARS